jgi:two-component system NtrC family sensor kinase
LLPLVRAGQERGVLFVESPFDQQRRLLSFRRVGEQPVYVTAALSASAIFAVWYRAVALLAVILLPITLVLVYLTWVALKKTRREQAMALELHEESRRRAKAEQALVQAQKLEALSQLTGGVAHDFNNLLAIVSNNLHVFKRLHPERADGPQIAAIARAVTSGVRLTRQLLSFSRKQALKPEPILLQQWLPATGDLLRTTIGRSIDLEIDVASGTAPVNVDANEFELALINVAVNAKDAMPDGGRLQIRAENTGEAPGMVMIRVSDTGSGIPADALEKVFDPFFTTKEAGKGTGLGLSQVYGLCVQAGGSATVDSTVGRGTVITMLLPQAGAAAVAKSSTLPQVPAQLQGRVLLVEDNDEVAAGIEALLRSAGLTVRLAFNADAALAMFLHGGEPFDAVLTDIAMPGSMNGIELAQRLRQAQPSLPVLLMTGYSTRVHEAVAAGWRVLTKPADPGDLLGELNRALQAAREGRAHLQPAS